MYLVKYRPLNKYITRYMPAYFIKEGVSSTYGKHFIKHMFTDDPERARKFNRIGHVKNSIGTNVSTDMWEIVEVRLNLKTLR